MRRLALFTAALALVSTASFGCRDNPAEPASTTMDPSTALLSARGNQPFEVDGGAIVTNGGTGDIHCRWGSYLTSEGSTVVTPAGNWKIDCQFKDVPDYWEHRIVRNWRCALCVPGQGCRYSYNSLWVQTGNHAHSYCHFNGNMRWE